MRAAKRKAEKQKKEWLALFEAIKQAIDTITTIELLDIVDVTTIANKLNIHPESVRRLIRQGRLAAVKWGNKWIVPGTYLDAYARIYSKHRGNKPDWYWEALESLTRECNKKILDKMQ